MDAPLQKQFFGALKVAFPFFTPSSIDTAHAHTLSRLLSTLCATADVERLSSGIVCRSSACKARADSYGR